jgi:hypothetical protein
MSLDLGKEAGTISTRERTWRVEFFCEAGDDAEIRIHRERILTITDGVQSVVKQRDIPVVSRRLSQIMGSQFTAAGVTVSGAQLGALFAAVADALRKEDMVAPTKVAEPPPPPT